MKVEVPQGVLNTATMIIVREYFGVDTGANDIAPDAYVSCQALAEDILAAVIPAIQNAALERAALIADEEAAYHYKAIPVENLTSDDPIACPAQQRMHVAETIAAAIRALMEPT